jgi:hypothetical protein
MRDIQILPHELRVRMVSCGREGKEREVQKEGMSKGRVGRSGEYGAGEVEGEDGGGVEG